MKHNRSLQSEPGNLPIQLKCPNSRFPYKLGVGKKKVESMVQVLESSLQLQIFQESRPQKPEKEKTFEVSCNIYSFFYKKKGGYVLEGAKQKK